MIGTFVTYIRDLLQAEAWTVRGSNPWVGEIFRSRPDRPCSPPSLPYNGYQVSFPGVKQPGRGVYHPPHLAPRLKSRAISLPPPLWDFVSCSRVNFTFIFLTRSAPSDHWSLFFAFSESFAVLAVCCAHCNLYAIVYLLMRQTGKVGGFNARSLVRAVSFSSCIDVEERHRIHFSLLPPFGVGFPYDLTSDLDPPQFEVFALLRCYAVLNGS